LSRYFVLTYAADKAYCDILSHIHGSFQQ